MSWSEVDVCSDTVAPVVTPDTDSRVLLMKELPDLGKVQSPTV